MCAGRSYVMLGGSYLLFACGSADAPALPAEAPSARLLVAADDWSPVSRTEDPYLVETDPVPDCVGPAYFVENDWLEIDTGSCNWVTLSASARFQVEVGQKLRLIVSHYDLSAIEPAEGVASVRLGECVLWERSVPIPSPAAVYDETLASPCSLEREGTLLFHVHNHGQNNWQLQGLSILH